ncbi:MAG TPA: UDP-3-O-(3-hydroxymyristoyl)glucosamine N-acyltransferase [Pirellulaceae bacterium]|nr:UDP-3-O-(3-hydroxymyristoyl)glucosamine N-acyltransferase [Pirellulaceae bacterium]
MSLTLAQIAQLIEGQLVGDGELSISGAATLSTARPGEITLCDNPKLAPQLARSQAAAVIVPTGFEPAGLPGVAVADVHAAFAKVVAQFRPQKAPRHVGIHPQAVVSLSARIGEGTQVHALAVIGDNALIGDGTIIHSGVKIADGCRIGSGTILFPNVVLYENTIVGNRVVIHGNAVVGAYGFGYSLVKGQHQLSAQLGYVEIEDDVEVGACTTIDRGTYGATIVGAGTKLDNHVMIAHNARIGRHNLICSQAGVAGSSTTGDYVVIAGQVGVRDHVHVGERAMIGGQSGVMNDVPAGQRVLGSPAIDEKDQRHIFAASFKLPEMRKELKKLQREVQRLVAIDVARRLADGIEIDPQQDAA